MWEKQWDVNIKKSSKSEPGSNNKDKPEEVNFSKNVCRDYEEI
jgi:hypothetical protein